jgi:hypothetical protein
LDQSALDKIPAIEHHRKRVSLTSRVQFANAQKQEEAQGKADQLACEHPASAQRSWHQNGRFSRVAPKTRPSAFGPSSD